MYDKSTISNGVSPEDEPTSSESSISHTHINHIEEDQGITDIISWRLPFVVRWGAVIFISILALLISFCWVIRYPDIISATGKLSSVNSPRNVITKRSGKLMRITANENKFVLKGAVLGYMESAADPEAIATVSKQLDIVDSLINKNDDKAIISLLLPLQSQYFAKNLGEIQTVYQSFIESFVQYKDVANGGFLLKKRAILLADLDNINRLNAVLIEQQKLLMQDLALSNATFEANKILAEKKVIADVDYRIEQSKLLAKRLNLPQVNIAIVNNENAYNAKQEDIIELNNKINTQKQLFRQALRTFKSYIQDWELKYIIKAPVSGNVLYTGFFQENQEIKLEETLFSIQPKNSLYYIQITIPQYNFGKIRIGQHVNLKFKAYPYEQYGSVRGILTYISKVPTENGYLAKVTLPNALLTNRSKILHYQQGLEVQAEIVTLNMRLLERLYKGLFKNVSQNTDY